MSRRGAFLSLLLAVVLFWSQALWAMHGIQSHDDGDGADLVCPTCLALAGLHGAPTAAVAVPAAPPTLLAYLFPADAAPAAVGHPPFYGRAPPELQD
jgi:hypothetical protein